MDNSLLVSDVLDTNAMAAMIVDRNGMVLFMNKTYLDILEKSEEEAFL